MKHSPGRATLYLVAIRPPSGAPPAAANPPFLTRRRVSRPGKFCSYPCEGREGSRRGNLSNRDYSNEEGRRRKKRLMIIPSIGSQLPNNFSRPTHVHSFAESFPSSGAFLLVLQIFAPKSKCGGGRSGVKALPSLLSSRIACTACTHSKFGRGRPGASAGATPQVLRLRIAAAQWHLIRFMYT